MPRGGFRVGAGKKPKWKHGETKTIRVPKELAEKILAIAHQLDEDGFLEIDTESKKINFSGVSVFLFRERTCVSLIDLFLVGYEIEPRNLAEKIASEVNQIRLSAELEGF